LCGVLEWITPDFGHILGETNSDETTGSQSVIVPD